MTTTAIREKLHNFINTADDKQVKAVYSILEDELAEKYDHWKDEEFLKEMDSRIKDIESGRVKGISWEEVKLKAQNRLRAKRSLSKTKKIDLMKQASSDPLFLADLKEISDDFAIVDNENI